MENFKLSLMFTFKNVPTSFGGGLVIIRVLYAVPMNGF